MKVLWLSPTPCLAIEKLKLKSFGSSWLIALSSAMTKVSDIELNIAFYCGEKMSPFEYKGITYYPIYRKYSGSKIGRLYLRLKGRVPEKSSKSDIAEVEKIISKVNPDVIHIHGTENGMGLIVMNSDIPTVISIQGIISAIVGKTFSGVPYSVLRKKERFYSVITGSSAKQIQKRMLKRARIEQLILKNADSVIGRTIWDRRTVLSINPNLKYYQGDEILRYPFYQYKWDKSRFSETIHLVSIVSGSNLAPYKGLELIYQVANILCKANFIFDWQIIGRTQSDPFSILIEDWLKKKASNFHIKFLGRKDATEIAEIFVKSDIYCQVSHIENSPNSLCEAMMVGLPSIATNVGGTSSLLEDGNSGFLVQEGEPYSFAGAIMELSRNFSLANEFSKEARRKALSRHSEEKVLTQMLDIYKNVILKR